MNNKLNKALNNFVKANDNIAKKYHAKVSIVFEGKETVIADHTKKSTKVELVEELLKIKGNIFLDKTIDNDMQLGFIVDKAKRGYYHDFESEIATPKVQLVNDLRNVGLKDCDELAEKVINGDFDE